MKNIAIISISLLILLGACGKKETPTIVSGILPDLKDETITLIPIDDYFPGLKSNDKFHTVTTDSVGRYKFIFKAKGSKFYQITKNNYHQLKSDIYLEPGDSLFIEQSPWSSAPKYQISGRGSQKLKHLERDYSIFPKDKSFYDKIRSNYFPSEIELKGFIDSIHFERVNALISFSAIPDLLRNHHLNTLKAERADLLLEYLEKRNYYTDGEHDYFLPDENYYNFLDSIEFDKDFSKTTAAKELANKYLNDQAQKAFKTKDEEEWWNENLEWKFSYISRQPKSPWTDLLALSTINEFSFGLMKDDFFDNLEKFERIMQNLFLREKYRSLFEFNIKPYKNLAPGSQAPDFELPDSNGTLHRLSDFKGNIVYIDFWGTWCYPCLQEIPDALVLQENYKDDPVTFLYVALEYDSTDIAHWKKFIAGKNQRFGKILNNKPFPGVHLVAEKQFRNESIGAYKINFAPTHVLIDQNGNIVKPRAKRSNEIHEEIDSLLKNFVDEYK